MTNLEIVQERVRQVLEEGFFYDSLSNVSHYDFQLYIDLVENIMDGLETNEMQLPQFGGAL